MPFPTSTKFAQTAVMTIVTMPLQNISQAIENWFSFFVLDTVPCVPSCWIKG